MIARLHYDRQTLAQFLGEVPAENDSDIAVHLEQCHECQATLESLFGEGLTMEAAGELLRDRAAEDLTWEPTGSDRSTELDRSTFLEASEHPGSLGRFARFEIMEFLGRGGMGIVMRGFDTSLNRHSAVKVLAPELAMSAAARKRFSREAKSAAAVVHPHVVPIQTVDEHDGLPYLVMPVVEGQSVDARVRNSGPLPVIEAVRIASQISEGLAAAHGQGLVHRDIKPANVLLENGVERVQITDFGLARAIDDASMTRSGVIAGTPQYMSPEQAHGDSIDHRSDLFSLGSLIYFMLTGHPPFRAETTMGVLNRIGNEQPRRLRSINPDIPEWFERIVMKLLAKPREDRFQTASEVAELLQSWHAHLQQPDMVDPPQKLDQKSLPVAGNGSRGGWMKWLIATAAMGFFALAGVMIILELNKGTLTIDSEADDVPIRIIQGDEVVRELTVHRGGGKIRIAAGQYIVELDDDRGDLEIVDGRVSLSRRGKAIASIVLSQPVDDAKTTAAPAEDLGSTRFNTPTVLAALRGRWQELDHEEGDDFNQTLVFSGGSLAQWKRDPQTHPVSVTYYVEGSELVLQFYHEPETSFDYRMKQLRFDYNLDGDSLMLTREGVTTRLHRIREQDPAKTSAPAQPNPVHESDLGLAQSYQQFAGGNGSPTPVNTLAGFVRHFNHTILAADLDASPQPPLTVEELRCFAQWKLQTDKQLSVEATGVLTDIGIGGWLPKQWRIEGRESQIKTSDGEIGVYYIELVSRYSDTKMVVRQRFLSAPVNFHGPRRPDPIETAMPLEAAITEFNAIHNEVDGLRQPPLTLEEVLAAILDWKSRRNEAPVDDKTFANFQEIALTHQLPADAKIEVLPNFETETGDTSKIWSVRIRMPQVAKPGSTMAFTIREQYLSVNSAMKSAIHWGKPNDDGLQAGFRLIPGQRTYQVGGESIETEFLYRSTSGKSVSATIPNVFSYIEMIARDAEGKKLDVVQIRKEMVVGGAIKTQIGEAPTRKRGQPLSLGYITPDPRYDTISPDLTYLTVKDGQKVFISYVVSDLHGGKLRTGELVIDIAETFAEPRF